MNEYLQSICVCSLHTCRAVTFLYREIQASSEHGFVPPGGSAELLILGTFFPLIGRWNGYRSNPGSS